jgi:hypothetical protein
MGDDVRVAEALLLDGLLRPFLVAMSSSSKEMVIVSRQDHELMNSQMSSYPPYPILR